MVNTMTVINIHRYHKHHHQTVLLATSHEYFISEFPRVSDLALSLQIPRIFSFSYGNPLAAYTFFLFVPSLISVLQ